MKMKNKKAEQAARKQKHKEALKGKRRQAPDLKRNAPAKEEKPTILIVCEGENTEPSYFRQFRLSNAIVKPIGINTSVIDTVPDILVDCKIANIDNTTTSSIIKMPSVR